MRFYDTLTGAMGSLGQISVTRKCAERIQGGHLWVHRNEVAHCGSDCRDGALVRISDTGGHFLAIGYLNTRSSIPARVLSFEEEEPGNGFVTERIKKALSLRLARGYPRDGSFRVVYSEGDYLPGLIMDKYGDAVVFQLLTLWMDRQRDTIISAIKELLNPSIIAERSDAPVRKKEGLSLRKSLIVGGSQRTVISLNGLSFEIDLLEGQKTGFYLDVQEIRQKLGPYVQGRDVLDCFSYSGAFSLHAIQDGARHALAVEETALGVELLRKNIELNGCAGKIDLLEADVFRTLKDITRDKHKYGCIILDPPSFAKSAREKQGALRGYREIAHRGTMLLEERGSLILTSCSRHISLDDLKDAVRVAQKKSGVHMEILGTHGQASDHPVLLGHPETGYLNCLITGRLG